MGAHAGVPVVRVLWSDEGLVMDEVGVVERPPKGPSVAQSQPAKEACGKVPVEQTALNGQLDTAFPVLNAIGVWTSTPAIYQDGTSSSANGSSVSNC